MGPCLVAEAAADGGIAAHGFIGLSAADRGEGLAGWNTVVHAGPVVPTAADRAVVVEHFVAGGRIEKVGEAARKLFHDAKSLLDDLVQGKLLTAKAVHGFWPAASDGDDIVLFADERRTSPLTRFHTLRQQWQRKGM